VHQREFIQNSKPCFEENEDMFTGSSEGTHNQVSKTAVEDP
jgi:hypothetical protein